ncbi:MAG TPA: putative toxin-antitoxin system toxin component, PIN family [Caldilineaceae bacterium]|nr:putative toxin-antitoxin system toxin component, PIN family [Caldilineaceae bacterium]
MRILLDTNVWISYLLTRNDRSTIRQVVQACLAGHVELIMPEVLIAELRASYPHLVRRINPDELDDLLAQTRQVARIPQSLPAELASYSRDPGDDYLLAYGLLLEADYLVTGDRDLLALGQVAQLRIVTPATFRRLLEEQGRA